jgi:hypothetical protein
MAICAIGRILNFKGSCFLNAFNAENQARLKSFLDSWHLKFEGTECMNRLLRISEIASFEIHTIINFYLMCCKNKFIPHCVFGTIKLSTINMIISDKPIAG